MKKNITINLCGRLFAIDEEAYEMLASYEQSLRNYFRTREGGEEISEDIEARIAELLDELKGQGVEAVTIEHVTNIIHRIGTPEEMVDNLSPDSPPEGEENGGGEPSSADGVRRSSTLGTLPNGREGRGESKRLYRNPDDKKLMGVLSGFAVYFGGDVLWWRLGYVAVVLLSFAGSSFDFLWFLPHNRLYLHLYFWGITFIVAYILLAILMPVAETPEDRLLMKGMEVNPQNLAEEITRLNRHSSRPGYEGGNDHHATDRGAAGYDTHGTVADATGGGSTLGNAGRGSGTWGSGHHGPVGCIGGTLGCIGGSFAVLWAVVSTLFLWCIYAFGLFISVMCLVGIVCLAAMALNPVDSAFIGLGFPQSEEFAAVLPELQIPIYLFMAAATVVLAITAYAIIHSLLNSFKLMPAMPYRHRIILLVMWFVSLLVAGAAVGYGMPRFIKAEEQYNSRTRGERYAEYRAENTHDGIFVQPYEWSFLQDGGWRIVTAENCNDRFTASGEHLSGDRDIRYLDCWDDHHRQRYRVERADTLQPGTYRLSCAARANGTGACIYAIIGDQEPMFREIPATGNEGGDIWVEANKFFQYHKNVPIPSDSLAFGNLQCDLAAVNHMRGFGWNRLVFENIRIAKPSVLRYGLTSDDAFTHHTWLGQYFSATDFEVSRVK